MSGLTQFKLHPAVIHSIIREQSGSPEKALAELVMNSIDAGAKNIRLSLSADKFCITDDGQGFQSLDEINNFFGTFGTPHKKGDAHYGQFRLGRGQAFAIAKTEWRSGVFGMSVDLACLGKTETHGYHLHEMREHVEGCEIQGEFYSSLHLIDNNAPSQYLFDRSMAEMLRKFIEKPSFKVFDGADFFSRLVCNLCLIRGVDIYLNGTLINQMVNTGMDLVHQSDTADYYCYPKSSRGGMVLLNKGIFIKRLPFSFPVVIDFKVSPDLNIARNQINATCAVYIKGRNELYEQLFEAWLADKKWAKNIGALIASSLSSHLTQFDLEMAGSVNKPADRLRWAKKYKVYSVSVQEISELTLWDALVKSQKTRIYLNLPGQNRGIAPKYFNSIVDNMKCCQNADGSPVTDSLLIDVNGALSIFLLEFQNGQPVHKLKISDWFGDFLEKPVLFQAHDFYKSTDDLESSALARMTIRKTSTAPLNQSLTLLSIIEQTSLRFEAPRSWVNKQDIVRQTMEDGLSQFQDYLSKLLTDHVKDIPEQLQKNLELKVKPVLVRKVYFSFLESKVVEVERTPYLVVAEESLTSGQWQGVYLAHLFSFLNQEGDMVYDLATFNEAFHDEITGPVLSEIFNALNQVSLQAVYTMQKKPTKGSEQREMVRCKQAWTSIIQSSEDFSENDEFSQAWKAFNMINI